MRKHSTLIALCLFMYLFGVVSILLEETVVVLQEITLSLDKAHSKLQTLDNFTIQESNSLNTLRLTTAEESKKLNNSIKSLSDKQIQIKLNQNKLTERSFQTLEAIVVLQQQNNRPDYTKNCFSIVAKFPSFDTYGRGSCSLIDKTNGVFLTAAHVLTPSKKYGTPKFHVMVDGVLIPFQNYVYYEVEELDLGLIKVDPVVLEGLDCEEVTLSNTEPVYGDYIVAAGHPFGWMHSVPFFTSGNFVDKFIDKHNLADTTHYRFSLGIYPGMSGGPVFNSLGEQISVNNIGGSASVSFGVRLSKIKHCILELTSELYK